MNLLECMTLPVKSPKWGDSIPNKTGKLYFRDNGASVLGVGHLDVVMAVLPTKIGNTVYGPQLDDRLGSWVLLNLLPQMGIKLDILLTDGEESGRSTAEFFHPEKEYNWMVEFDRHGDDLVMYNYKCPAYTDILTKYGFDVNWGSFSDICSLDHLGVAGINVGTGYYQEHTHNCHANLTVTRAQAVKFAKFWSDYKDIKLMAPEEESLWWHGSYQDYTKHKSESEEADEQLYTTEQKNGQTIITPRKITKYTYKSKFDTRTYGSYNTQTRTWTNYSHNDIDDDPYGDYVFHGKDYTKLDDEYDLSDCLSSEEILQARALAYYCEYGDNVRQFLEDGGAAYLNQATSTIIQEYIEYREGTLLNNLYKDEEDDYNKDEDIYDLDDKDTTKDDVQDNTQDNTQDSAQDDAQESAKDDTTNEDNTQEYDYIAELENFVEDDSPEMDTIELDEPSSDKSTKLFSKRVMDRMGDLITRTKALLPGE